ncbi:Hsp20/alpha crystallin family protein [Fulvivirga sedimenti]|uniref:Hsp20/alpha crystallin family protein n=1 Tax=Fulvivirga sedimenti TaxID=2879465 RepID=A0A9X1HP02_9BACT|nr:Hsp20/alpha crystallin family protein [Fulvivirga sedimenti]MCA6074127.1 Hsp20/alpha crystallin family protein [Fulvivirga sedimenti]
MALVRYNPLNDFIPATFGNLVENFINDRVSDEPVFMPAVDIVREDNQILLHVYAPGMKKDQFTIDLNEHQLIIAGERTLDDEARKKFTKIESRYGKFRRVFKLNEDINEEKITAEYQDGILKIVLPFEKKKETKKVIQIK